VKRDREFHPNTTTGPRTRIDGLNVLNILNDLNTAKP
jgi:hypothetical protein